MTARPTPRPAVTADGATSSAPRLIALPRRRPPGYPCRGDEGPVVMTVTPPREGRTVAPWALRQIIDDYMGGRLARAGSGIPRPVTCAAFNVSIALVALRVAAGRRPRIHVARATGVGELDHLIGCFTALSACRPAGDVKLSRGVIAGCDNWRHRRPSLRAADALWLPAAAFTLDVGTLYEIASLPAFPVPVFLGDPDAPQRVPRLRLHFHVGGDPVRIARLVVTGVHGQARRSA